VYEKIASSWLLTRITTVNVSKKFGYRIQN